jgi:molybdopterin synthase sulfurtransferase
MLGSSGFFPSAAAANCLILDVGDNNQERYLAEHIPGAIYLDTNSFEHAPDWNILPWAELMPVLLAHGVTPEKRVALYGATRWGVARAALVVLYAGVQEVHWIPGGLDAWKASGQPVEAGSNDPIPESRLSWERPAHPEFVTNFEQVQAMLAHPDAVVADVRTWEEHSGLVSGYSYIQSRGHIPGSVWVGEVPAQTGSSETADYEQRSQQASREIAASWHDKGLTPEKHIAFYCGTGWRASEAFWYAYKMGWKNISVYDGSWLEWSSRMSSPGEQGKIA